MRPYGCWKNVCYILYAHRFLSNSLHLTIGSSLTLIQNELWVPKCFHVHFKVFSLMFKVSKICHQDLCLLHTYYRCYTSLFWEKNGEKWFTYIVFSPIQPHENTHLFMPFNIMCDPHVILDNKCDHDMSHNIIILFEFFICIAIQLKQFLATSHNDDHCRISKYLKISLYVNINYHKDDTWHNIVTCGIIF
jgi:hypothetical protein